MTSTRPFRAFVSYCHADAAFAAWLQRRLESYRVPRRLSDRVAPLPGGGESPGRVGPVFRDRADLSAATDLSAAVREAIALSSALIVVASPDAAKSIWVEREIALFRELHPGAPILVALARGEPEESLPEALRLGDAEPLAADFRREGDGQRLAFLKLVAALLDLPLDPLVQRDAQRQVRRVTAVTLGAVTMVVIMALLLVMALRARDDAERHQAGAEGLVEYMLTDLRDRLKGVGRPDVMAAVNARALNYYAAQGDLDRFSDDSLNRRARVLLALGDDNQSMGKLDLALASFQEAHRTTAAILAKKPGDPDRIFAHAQSEFYVGLIARKRSDRARTSRHWRAYLSQAQALARAEPAGLRALEEQAFAWGNLCDLDLHESYDLKAAEAACSRSVHFAHAALQKAPQDRDRKVALANRLGWLADAYFLSKRFDQAFAIRETEARLLDELLALDPLNVDYQMRRSWADLGRARIWLERKRPRLAVAILNASITRFPQVFDGKTELSDLMFTRLRARLLLAKGLRHLDRNYSEDLALADLQQKQLAGLNQEFAKRSAAIRASIWP